MPATHVTRQCKIEERIASIFQVCHIPPPPPREHTSVRAPTHTLTIFLVHVQASARPAAGIGTARPRRTVYISAPAGVPWRHFIQTWSRPNTKIRTWPRICRSIFSRNGHRGWTARCDDNFFFSFSFDLDLRYIDYIIQSVIIARSEYIYIERIFINFFLAISGEEIGKVYQNIINQIDWLIIIIFQVLSETRNK